MICEALGATKTSVVRRNSPRYVYGCLPGIKHPRIEMVGYQLDEPWLVTLGYIGDEILPSYIGIVS